MTLKDLSPLAQAHAWPTLTTSSTRRQALRAAAAAALAAAWGPGRAQTAGPSTSPPAVMTRFAATAREASVLHIDSSTDTALFAPAIRDFQRLYPSVTVQYTDRQSLDIHARALALAGLLCLHVRHQPGDRQRQSRNPYWRLPPPNESR